MQIKTSLYILLTSAITFSACTHNKKTENTQIQTVSKLTIQPKHLPKAT